MAKKTGSLCFGSDNYMLFVVNNSEEDSDDEGSHMLKWQPTPAEMAKALREAADWLDAHSADAINVDID